MSDSLPPQGLQPSRLLCPWDSPGKIYWSGLPCPPPGDLPNPGVPHTAGRFFTMWASREGLAFEAQRHDLLPALHPPKDRHPTSTLPQSRSLMSSERLLLCQRVPTLRQTSLPNAHVGLARLSYINPYKWVTSAPELPAPSPHPHSSSPGVTVPWRELQAFVLAGHSCFDCDPPLLFCLAEKRGRKNKSPLLLFSGEVTSDVLWPQGRQHTRLPVLHRLPEFAQTHVHWVGDAIQLSHPHPLLLLPSILPSSKVFSRELALHIRWLKVLEL